MKKLINFSAFLLGVFLTGCVSTSVPSLTSSLGDKQKETEQPQLVKRKIEIEPKIYSNSVECEAETDDKGNLVFEGTVTKSKDLNSIVKYKLSGFYQKRARLLTIISCELDYFHKYNLWKGDLSSIKDKNLRIFKVKGNISPEYLADLIYELAPSERTAIYGRYFKTFPENITPGLKKASGIKLEKLQNLKLYACILYRVVHSKMLKNFWKIILELESTEWKEAYKKIENISLTDIQKYKRLYWRYKHFKYPGDYGIEDVKIIAYNANDLSKKTLKHHEKVLQSFNPFAKKPKYRSGLQASARTIELLLEAYVDPASQKTFDFETPEDVIGYLNYTSNYLTNAYGSTFEKEAQKKAREICPSIVVVIERQINNSRRIKHKNEARRTGIMTVKVYKHCNIADKKRYQISETLLF